MRKILATAKVTEHSDRITIDVVWSAKVDRPCTGGWSVGKHERKLAERLARAIDAQAAVAKPAVSRDANGKTYVSFNMKVLGRHMNADLRRLGY